MRRHTIPECITATLLRLIGICTHQNITWPQISLRRGERGINVNCLDCAKRIPYRNPEFFGGADAAFFVKRS